MDGLDVITGLRGWTNVPIVVVSGRDAEGDKIAALGAGADDYLTKPFGMGELVARLRAVLRRCRPARAEQPIVATEHFVIDLLAKRAVNSDGEVRLTPKEWGIVEMLVRNAGRLVTHKMLLHEVWGPEYEFEAHYLRVYMTQIRRKLEPNPALPRYFMTEPGLGLRFEPQAHPLDMNGAPRAVGATFAFASGS
jgi:two-component system, OmpR family, KDP operon response regulator KdpE